MPKIIEGSKIAKDAGIGIVVSRFNEFITQKLLDGALDTLRRHGVDPERVTVAWCPGSVEIPLVAKKMADSGKHDAVLALGAVIRGETSHYDLVCSSVANGTLQASMDSGVPVVFGVITTDTVEQAIDRAGSKAGNKGADAAVAAIEMINLLRQL